MEYIAKSPAETQAFAKVLARQLKSGMVIAFEGDLGAGKTCFTHGLCEGLEFTGEVSSPTFAIVNVYLGGKMPIYHFDMYRINGWDDLETTGYFDYTERGDGITVVEWSENIHSALPDDTIFIKIEKIDQNSRKITLSGGGF
ncbi:MAG: tRNA (adenosine(37)-N6)-threonylcarbamoyltransferase complex ATPase subunit type 1 TsaE [Ruminococcaceae bacterium]|nr:tRNA (adenosine(37)-N6)-threonylcarbamoyltransferase complex ATPase subunit type 1 TsaE [Oscillospiraceae bacterium]